MAHCLMKTSRSVPSCISLLGGCSHSSTHVQILAIPGSMFHHFLLVLNHVPRLKARVLFAGVESARSGHDAEPSSEEAESGCPWRELSIPLLWVMEELLCMVRITLSSGFQGYV